MHEGLVGPARSRGSHGGEYNDVIGGVAPDTTGRLTLQPARGSGQHRSVSRRPLHDEACKGILSRRRRSAKPGEERSL